MGLNDFTKANKILKETDGLGLLKVGTIGYTIALHAVEAALSSQSEPEYCTCCKGTGEVMVMDGNGPDAQEIPANCPHCEGLQTLAEAYRGVCKLLDSSKKQYLEVCAQLYMGQPRKQSEPIANKGSSINLGSIKGLVGSLQGVISDIAPCEERSRLIKLVPYFYAEIADISKSQQPVSTISDKEIVDIYCEIAKAMGVRTYPEDCELIAFGRALLSKQST